MSPETNEADALEQQRDVSEADEQDVPATVDTEADPADVSDQHRPVPADEEDWPDA